MGKKQTTPTFVTEIPLQVSNELTAKLNKRFEAGRQVYNACLSECLKRLDAMRGSSDWKEAIALKTETKRKAALKPLFKRFGFREYDLHPYAKQFGYYWIGHHVDSQTVKRLATRAFNTTHMYAFQKNGIKRGRPKFKRFGELNALESINNTQGIVWRDGVVRWNAGNGKNDGNGIKSAGNGNRAKSKILELEAIVTDDPVMQHGLSSRIKYVRLVRRNLNGKTRFYAQLVNEGHPYQRFHLGHGDVGIDIGPSTIAIVAIEHKAQLQQFCEELADKRAEIKRLQRHLDRQRRANNPDNYNPDGTVKPRSQLRRWVKSNRQLKTELRLREIKRKEAAYRKCLHGQLVNKILQMGDTVLLEKLSYVAFQKRWGKSVGTRAPGMFVEKLRQKVIEAGGMVEEFSPYKPKLSQLDHTTGEYRKKPLSQRWHTFDDGCTVQRDLYSAFLAACIEDGEFQKHLADERWSVVKPMLDHAIQDIDRNGNLPASFGL